MIKLIHSHWFAHCFSPLIHRSSIGLENRDEEPSCSVLTAVSPGCQTAVSHLVHSELRVLAAAQGSVEDVSAIRRRQRDRTLIEPYRETFAAELHLH